MNRSFFSRDERLVPYVAPARKMNDVQTGPSVAVGNSYGMPRGGNVSVGEGCGSPQPSFPWYPQQMSAPVCLPPGERETAMGLPVTTIEDGETKDITLNAPNLFQGNCLTIPSDIIAAGLFVEDIKVGAQSQILSGPLPARLFSEVSQSKCRYIRMQPATAGQPITIRVSNATGAPVQFQGAIEGRTLNC